MRLVTILSAAILVSSAATPLLAQGRGNGQAKKAPSTAAPVKPVKADAPKAGKATAKTDTAAAKTAAKADSRAVKQSTKAADRTAKADAKVAKKAPAPILTTTAPSATPTTPTTTRVKNAKLESRLQAMLPPGATVSDASAGFKNWGQFVAAVHVSKNLGIPFDNLKAAMTGIPVGTPPGTTPPVTTTPLSLGQAIQSLKGTSPQASSLTETRVTREVKRAEDSAADDLRQTRERS